MVLLEELVIEVVDELLGGVLDVLLEVDVLLGTLVLELDEEEEVEVVVLEPISVV